jgi:RWD domain.
MSENHHAEFVEQKDEIEILQSIYMDEIEVLTNVPPYKFVVHCRPYLDHSLRGELDKYTVKVEVEFSANYPNEAPKCELKHHLDKVTNYEIQQVYDMIKSIAEQMKGEAMVFEIIESIRVRDA